MSMSRERNWPKVVAKFGAAAIVLALGVRSTSAANLPASYYWTIAQANAAVLAQAKTPLCKVFPNEPSYCVNGQPVAGQEGRVAVGHVVSCAGEKGFASRGRYSRFVCDLEGANQVGQWTLEVRTAGAAKIRWKLVG